jgi:polyisoprenoid-binding protein YceI
MMKMKTMTSLLLVVALAPSLHAQAQQTVEARKKAEPAPRPVTLESGVALLAPANTKIGFIGEHEGPKPDPRKGGFTKFVGKVQIGSDGSLQAVGFDIETASLFTEIPKLTGHLKSPDFFDVRQHPRASFRSTSVAAAKKSGQVNVTGKFTLLGTTREMVIPAAVSASPQGIMLVSNFAFDRTKFGMTYGEGKVKKKVVISVVVGQPTTSKRN